METYMWIIWFGVLVLSIIVEALTPELLSVWFGLGAIVALILSIIEGIPWWVELIVFMVVSVVSLLALRPIIKKYAKTNKTASNIDEIVGKKGKMIKSCDEINHGEVKINGVIWTAIGADGHQNIKEDSLVEVVAIEGNKLIVKEIEKEN